MKQSLEFNPQNIQSLKDHRGKIAEWFASDAFKALDGVLEAAQATYRERALAEGVPAEKREESRALYHALAKVRQLPQYVQAVLDAEDVAE